MNRIDVGDLCGGNDAVDAQVTFFGRSAADADGAVGVLQPRALTIGFGIDADGLNAELARSADVPLTLALVVDKKRRNLVEACAATICADREVTVAEAELLRGICDMLDCPMPPLLPGGPTDGVERDGAV